MTISTSASTVTYQGNGTTTVFPFAFPVSDPTTLVVTVTDTTQSPAVVTTLTAAQYGVTGIGNPTGGSVTYPLSGAPLAVGLAITLSRVVPYVQDTSLANQGGFYPDVIEEAMDDIVMQTQQLAAGLAQAVTVPVGTSPANYLAEIQTSATSAATSAAAAAGSATTATTEATNAAASATAAAASAASLPNATSTGTDKVPYWNGTEWVGEPIRTILTTTTTFYVATTGSDVTGDGSSGNPWATRGHAWSVLCSGYDLAGNAVVINLANGTYTDSAVLSGVPVGWTNFLQITFSGNTTTPANCLIQPASGPSFQADDGAQFVVQGFKFDGSNGGSDGIVITNGSQIGIGAGIIFGKNPNHNDIQPGTQSRLTILDSYTIDKTGEPSPYAVTHIQADPDTVTNFSGSITITMVGTPTYQQALLSFAGCFAALPALTLSGSWSAPLEIQSVQNAIVDIGSNSQAPFSNVGAVAAFSPATVGSSAGSAQTASWTIPEIVAKTSLGGPGYYGSALSLPFNGANAGAGGMDTGSMPSGGSLYIYAIYDPTTNGWATLGTVTAPASGSPIYGGSHLPSGYSASCLLWSGVTVGTNLPKFQQRGRRVGVGKIFIFSAASGVNTYTSQSLSAAVPANALTASGFLEQAEPASTAVQLQVSSTVAGDVGFQSSDTVASGTSGNYKQLNFRDVPMVTIGLYWYTANTAATSCYMSIIDFTF